MNKQDNSSPKEKSSESAEKRCRRSFIPTLFQILEDGAHSEILSWTDDGKSVMLKDLAQLGEVILPRFFGNTKYASFIRQLSFYGFKRSSRSYAKGHIYYHDNFCRGKSDLLNKIRRKSKKTSSRGELPQIESSNNSSEGAYGHDECQAKYESLYVKLNFAKDLIKELQIQNLQLKRLIDNNLTFKVNAVPQSYPGLLQNQNFSKNPAGNELPSSNSRRMLNNCTNEHCIHEHMKGNLCSETKNANQSTFLTNLYKARENTFAEANRYYDQPFNQQFESNEYNAKPLMCPSEDYFGGNSDISELNHTFNPNFGGKFFPNESDF